jgi:hypothetical protein
LPRLRQRQHWRWTRVHENNYIIASHISRRTLPLMWNMRLQPPIQVSFTSILYCTTSTTTKFPPPYHHHHPPRLHPYKYTSTESFTPPPISTQTNHQRLRLHQQPLDPVQPHPPQCHTASRRLCSFHREQQLSSSSAAHKTSSASSGEAVLLDGVASSV